MNKQIFPTPHEGEIWLVKFDKLKEFSKPLRPYLVVSNNFQNELDQKIVVVTLTSEDIENIEPFEVFIKDSKESGLDQPSKILCNYPHTINKQLRLLKHLGTIDNKTLNEVKVALKIVLNL